MALVIEDGSIVAGANSYITLVELRAYAASRNITLPTSDVEVEPMVILGADYVESYELKYRGKRIESDQPMAWPRSGVRIYGDPFAPDAIPPQLKKAQLHAAVLVSQGIDLMPNITAYAIRRQKVDVIEVEYATGGGVNNTSTEEITPRFPFIDTLLRPLFNTDNGGLLKVYRA